MCNVKYLGLCLDYGISQTKRSVSNWGIGQSQLEQSILKAYVRLGGLIFAIHYHAA